MTSHLEEGLLQELLDGEIPSSELPPIQAHLAVCAECRARLDEARAIGAEADRLIETIDLTETVSRLAPRIQPARPKAWVRNVAWAATLVIAAGTGYLARGTDSVTIENRPVAPAEESKAASIPAVPATPSPVADQSAQPADQPARERDKGAASVRVPGGAGPERKTAATGALRQLAAGADSDSALMKTRKFPDTGLKLEELVVTGVAEPASPRPPAPSPPKASTSEKTLGLRTELRPAGNANRLDELTVAGAAAKRAARPEEITLPEALRRLDGSLRLIEGLVPLRLEALGADVRVVYPLASGELLLSQRLENGKLTYRLVAPAGFPADSLERLRARVRD